MSSIKDKTVSVKAKTNEIIERIRDMEKAAIAFREAVAAFEDLLQYGTSASAKEND